MRSELAVVLESPVGIVDNPVGFGFDLILWFPLEEAITTKKDKITFQLNRPVADGGFYLGTVVERDATSPKPVVVDVGVDDKLQGVRQLFHP